VVIMRDVGANRTVMAITGVLVTLADHPPSIESHGGSPPLCLLFHHPTASPARSLYGVIRMIDTSQGYVVGTQDKEKTYITFHTHL
jgi:hypothetical protein